jgi:hypothetical protein
VSLHASAKVPALTLLAGLMFAAGLVHGALPTNEYRYRIDTTGSTVHVTARFQILQSKDFAFLGTLSGRPVAGLEVQDRRGARQVSATGEAGVYKVDGLEAGTISASYDVELDANCTNGSCRDQGGVVLIGRDVLLHPMGVDPTFPTPCRIDFSMPRSWILITPDGELESPLRARSLAEAGAWPLLAGDLVVAPNINRDLLVVQATGWQVAPESVGVLVAGFMAEQNRLLGTWRDESSLRLTRIVPTSSGTATFSQTTSGLEVVYLPEDADRRSLATAIVKPLSRMFRDRLRQGLQGASSPETRWWREGFTEYTTLLAGVRARSLEEQVILDRLLAAWLNVAKRSPLARQTSPVAAGSLEGADAAAYVRDAGLLATFLLDLQIRQATGNTSGVGELLAATRGRTISNDMLRREASRLARTDLSDLFQSAVLGPGPAPLRRQAPQAGLEMTDVGTGEVFTGMSLAADEPVILRVFDAGPAKARGLKTGDLIVELNGQPIVSTAQVDHLFASHHPGDAVEIKVETPDGQSYATVLDMWEKVSPVLRRSRNASLAALNAWSNLVRGEATTFAN